MQNLFAGRRVLLVEDDYWIAADLAPKLEAVGVEVVGPVADLSGAMRRLADTPDLFGAILDINLRGEMVFPLADELSRRTVPYVFVSSYDRSVVPKRFDANPLLQKPARVEDIIEVFLRQAQSAPERAGVSSNRLLHALGEEDHALLRSMLIPVRLDKGQVLEAQGRPIDTICFVESGLVSLVLKAETEAKIQVGMIGREGVTGSSIALGDNIASHTAMVQVPGSGLQLPADDFLALCRLRPSLASTLAKFYRTLSIQQSYTLLANRHFSLERRIARWLLMVADRLQTQRIPLTHDHLATMMGVRRPGVTVALHQIEGLGLIKSNRGEAILSDRRLLEDFCVGIYSQAEQDYARIMGFSIKRDAKPPEQKGRGS